MNAWILNVPTDNTEKTQKESTASGATMVILIRREKKDEND